MNVEFIYDSKESRYCGLECYSAYDLTNQEYMYDARGSKISVALNREKKILFFFGMDSKGDYILDKMFYFKLIKQYLRDNEEIAKEYTICPHTVGGEIYFKYN